jgi:dolichol-phosphate mannosyltransferase
MINKIFKHFTQPKYITFLKYCIVGFSGIIINNGLLYVLTEYMTIFYIISSLISIEVSKISNFILNDKWTFKNDKSKSLINRFVLFEIISIGGVVLNLILLYVLVDEFKVYYIYANILLVPIILVWNYLLNRYITWSKKGD